MKTVEFNWCLLPIPPPSLQAFVHDPLINWRLLAAQDKQLSFNGAAKPNDDLLLAGKLPPPTNATTSTNATNNNEGTYCGRGEAMVCIPLLLLLLLLFIILTIMCNHHIACVAAGGGANNSPDNKSVSLDDGSLDGQDKVEEVRRK